MSKHTPGPWEVKRSRSGYPYRIYAPNADDHRNGAVGRDVTRWGAFSLPSSKEAEANARLIAAAPDLLEALREIAKGEGPFSTDRLTHAENCIEAMQEIARVAIAKAEGHES